MSASQHVLSGSRLRRGAHSRAQIKAFEVPGEGVRSDPTIAFEIDPHIRAVLTLDPHSRTILTCNFT